MDIFETIVLVHVVRNLKTPTQFLLDTFFPRTVESDTEFVAIDVDVGKRRMSPFVSPLVEGKLVESRTFKTDQFKPAYIKDKRIPDLRRPVRRMIGERIGGEMSAAARMEANLAFELEDQLQMLQRRLEWMAAQALLLGTVTITGDGYATSLVDFNRDAALTTSLTSTATWTAAHLAGAPTATPAKNVEDWALLVLQKSGAPPTDILFDTNAWEVFRLDQTIKDSIWFPRSGDSQIEFGGGVQKGAVYKGNWGNYRLWVYNEWYIDDNDVEQPMIPANTVILGGANMEGVRAYGAIMDPAFAYGALAYAPKSWIQPEPAQRFLMMQSAPIVIPSRVNHSMCVTVA